MRHRPLPSRDELLQELAEHGVTDAPTEAPDEASLRALLDFALYVAEHRKRVRFPGFTWDDPAFVAEDDKLTMRIAYARLDDATPARLDAFLREQAERVREGHALLALDLHQSDAREFQLTHHLYGAVTLFSWPHKPSESADPRIHAALDAGWTKTLKEHNLVPGRGIVVLDEHQGVLLRDEALADLQGLLVLLPTGQTNLLWNPFVRGERNQSELQYWLSWGPGGPASAWKEMLHVTDED